MNLSVYRQLCSASLASERYWQSIHVLSPSCSMSRIFCSIFFLFSVSSLSDLSWLVYRV